MTWYTLASTTEDHEELVARFLPDAFTTSSECPVLVVTIRDATDRRAAVEILSKFRDSYMVDYALSPTQFTAVSDYDWEEWTISAASVALVLSPYSLDELMSIATRFSEMLQDETSKSYAKSRKISGIEHFVCDLIARAEAKMSLSAKSRSTLESQVDVLTRVLNRIRDA